MALPKLNVTPTYTLTIPSTGQTVHYRPYLVKEEKLLLLAFESQDIRSSLQEIVKTIENCVESDVDISSLTTFDIEYMFLKIRGKSVGETAHMLMNCQACGTENEVEFNVDAVDIEYPEEKLEPIIELTDKIQLELRHPTYGSLVDKIEGEGENLQIDPSAVTSCIVAIHTPDERIDPSDYTTEELEEFIESMTITQMNQIKKYLSNVPVAALGVEFTCKICRKVTNKKITGVQNFF